MGRIGFRKSHISPHILSILLPILLLLFLVSSCAAPWFMLPETVRQLSSRLPVNQPASGQRVAQTSIEVSSTNRLLVLGRDGNIYTIDPDGGNRLFLTSDAGESKQYQQPTWSPTGEQIAWSSVDVVGERVRGSLLTSRFDGSNLNQMDVAYPPFYIYWSPLGDRLAYLSNWVDAGKQSLALRVFALDADSPQATTLAKGQPFYFSWSPDGERMIGHIGMASLELLSIDQEPTAIDASPASFSAPQWLLTEDLLVYAVSESAARTQRLIVSDLAGNEQAEIVEFEGRISFSANSTGETIAYILTSADAQMSSLGALYTADWARGTIQEVSDDDVVAFFWSPDGEKLAYMQLEEVGDVVGTRWVVWDGSKRTEYDFVVPSGMFVNNYLPFFDQYSRSMTIWSPDSRAFAYAGITTEQQAGIWVQELGEEQEPILVDGGVFVSWSPR